MTYVRVFEPADAVELAAARVRLEALGVDFFVEGEHYFGAAGGFISLADTRVWIQGDETDAERAREVLDEVRGG